MCIASWREMRAVDGARTRDPRLGKPMLYQLSHYRVIRRKITPFYVNMQIYFRRRTDLVAEEDEDAF